MGWNRWTGMAIFAACAAAHAAEESDLSTRSRISAAMKAAEAQPANAPFVTRRESLAQAFRTEAASTARTLTCADLSMLCFDARDRGLVYRGARGYMPRTNGLTPEGVAVRHDRVILRYSFR